MADATDATLVDAMRRGDEDAFARLYAAHQAPLFRYALYMCGPGAADDVVQETFLALLRGERFDPARGTLAAYLFGISRHHIVKHLSAARLEIATDPEEMAFPSGAEAPSSRLQAGSRSASPFDTLSRTESIAAVRAAVQTLPLVYREVVTLCELEELDYAAAAGVVGCPVGTIRSRLSRARALLSAKLAAQRREVAS